MKKTQAILKTSFKGLIDLQSQKLPQKKSRSRSIRDQNNTTSNQFQLSRAIQHQGSHAIMKQTRTRQGTWVAGNTHHNLNQENQRKWSQEGIVKFDDNLSSNLSRHSENESRNWNRNDSRNKENKNNDSRNEGSMQKIRENMRKQSQQLKSKIRQRSESRRNRKNSASQNSHNPFSRQHSPQNNRNPYQQPQNQQQLEQLQQKQALNQIINLKNQFQVLQYHYSNFGSHLRLRQNKDNYGANHLEDDSQRTQIGREQDLMDKAQELNNLLEMFHITFKENLAKTQQKINHHIEDYKNHHFNTYQNKHLLNQNNNKFKQSQLELIASLIDKVQTQFCIKGNHSKNSPVSRSEHLFTYMKQDKRTNFTDLEKKLLLAQQRFLK